MSLAYGLRPVTERSAGRGARRGAAVLGTATLTAKIGTLLLIAAALLFPESTMAADDSDLSRARELVREHQYEEAYRLLSPLEQTMQSDPSFDYLLGRAALGLNRTEDAKRALERAVARQPDSTAARLALGRAFYGAGQYAKAKIEFETVLHLENLPRDLRSQVEIYAASAKRYLEEDDQGLGFEFIEAGIGRYHATYPQTSNAMFYDVNAGGALNYPLFSGFSLEVGLDYAFRLIDARDTHNDSDLDWEAGLTRGLGDSKISFGARGAASYIGNGDYRNDYGGFVDWNRELTSVNELVAGVYVRRRQYPSGPLSERSRTIAEGSIGWIRALSDGASLSVTAHGGYQYATVRPDGASAFYGLTAQLDYTFTKTLNGFLFGWWEANRFNADQIHFQPDSVEYSAILRRHDHLYEAGGGLVWEFAPAWTLRPQVLYVRDDSNIADFHYRSVEVWANVRRTF